MKNQLNFEILSDEELQGINGGIRGTGKGLAAAMVSGAAMGGAAGGFGLHH